MTAIGCLFWAAGLCAAIICICDYYRVNDSTINPQYYIWYQSNFVWCQWLIAFLCGLVALLWRNISFGVYLHLMASLGLLFGLMQAPVPRVDDISFEQGKDVLIRAHIEEALGLKTYLINDIVCNGHVLECHSSIFSNKVDAGKDIFATAKVGSLKNMSRSSVARALKNGVFSCLRIVQVKETYWSSKKLPVFVQMRKTMVERHEQILGKTNGTLLASIVLGDKVVDLPASVKIDFRRSGVSHLLAASGFNLSIFITAMCLCLRTITRYGAIIAFAGILSVLCFVLLAGLSPSVVRAAIWAILLLLLKLKDSRINLFALFSFSMFLHLIIDPFSILDIGWQLSYAATASIICGVQHLESEFSEKSFSVMQAVIKWLRSATVVVLMAQAAVLPLACLYFKQINLLFLPVNLLLDPLVAPLTILGFISSWAGLLWRELAWCLDMLAYYPLEYMLWVTSSFAKLEFSQVDIKPPPLWILVEYSTALIYFVFANQSCKDKPNSRFASVVFYLSLLLLLLSSICP